jgi:hypothetical protein
MELPNYLVETSDGNLFGYVRDDLLRIDLALHRRDDDRAKRVLKLNGTLPITYLPTDEFGEFTAIPLQNFCDRHKRQRLPRPTVFMCADCEKEGADARA